MTSTTVTRCKILHVDFCTTGKIKFYNAEKFNRGRGPCDQFRKLIKFEKERTPSQLIKRIEPISPLTIITFHLFLFVLIKHRVTELIIASLQNSNISVPLASYLTFLKYK